MPIGTGEFLTIHSLVSWIFFPVDKSMTVSAPHLVDHVSFSTSSWIEDDKAEFPIFAFTLILKFLPIIIGSISGWLIFAGITALPEATSSRTNSGVIIFGRLAPKFSPVWYVPCLKFSFSSLHWFSRIAMYSISSVILPCLASDIWVEFGREAFLDFNQLSLNFGSPFSMSIETSGSE